MSKGVDEADEPVEPGSSPSAILELVGPDQRVLNLGCATGHLARALALRGCTVVGVEEDAAAAAKAEDVLEELVVAGMDGLDLVETFGEGSFDVVVYDDVLGRLRDPRGSLRQARRLLRPGGSLVASVHNVGHGDIRLALLAGHWDYGQSGPLDETQLRFYTYETLRALLLGSGLVLIDTRRVERPMFGTEVTVSAADHPADVVAAVAAAPESRTYQFVVRAVPDDADGAVALLSQREHAAATEAAALRSRVEHLERQVAATEDRLALAEAERDLRIAAAEHALKELAALRGTRTFRWSQRARRIYSRLRGGRP